MATVEIYGPSSHSQSVDAPATIRAEADVVNMAFPWRYVQMVITGHVSGQGTIQPMRPGVELRIVATASIDPWMQGRNLTVTAELNEVTAGGTFIKRIDSHDNFRIRVFQQAYGE